MGSLAHVVVAGRPPLLTLARRRLEQLESAWTRFRPSELTSLNASHGEWVQVSGDLYLLVDRALTAWRETRGLFDPTVLDALAAHGYDRPFDTLSGVAQVAAEAVPVPGCGAIRLDPERRRVRMPAGVHLDPGGIGKGLAADIVARDLMAAGAAGVLVSVGGDVRVRGDSPDGGAWTVSVTHPLEPRTELARMTLEDGAVATSSRLRRAWETSAGPGHHVIDPASGRPARTPVAAATVVAGEGWWAEALATAMLVAGPGWRDVLNPVGTPAMVLADDGRITATEGLRGALR